MRLLKKRTKTKPKKYKFKGKYRIGEHVNNPIFGVSHIIGVNKRLKSYVAFSEEYNMVYTDMEICFEAI